ncbi:hypothetical protein RKD46_000443 [Streptomyces pseudovenezuelae]
MTIAGFTEQRRRDAEPLSHAEGKGADALAGHAGQSGELDDLVHPAPRDAVRVRERHQMVERAAAGMDGLGLQQGADLVQRCPVLRVRHAVDGHRTLGGGVQTYDHAHGGGLAGTVGAEEAGDLTGLDGEAQLVDDGLVAVPLGQLARFDHGCGPFSLGLSRANPPRPVQPRL